MDGGGTGAAADIVAGAYALAGTPPSGSSPASFLYTNPGGSYINPGSAYPYDTGLNDITSGSTGTCSLSDMCNAAPGYDGPTGVGTPSSIMSLTSRTVTGVVYSNIIPSGNGLEAGDGEGPDFCLDNKQSTIANGNPMDIWACNGNTDSQQWSFGTDGTVQVGGDCLGVSGGGTANGTAAILFACDGHTSQDWSSQANGLLVNENSGKCLYDPVAPGSGTPRAGDELEIDTCGTSAAASQGFGWYLPVAVPTATGPITIQSSGDCLGSGLLPVTCDGSAGQKWSVKATGAIENGGSCMSQAPVSDIDGGAIRTLEELGTTSCSNDIEPEGPLISLASGVLKNEVDGSCLSPQTDPDQFDWLNSGCTRFTLP
ncbi:MAG: ricin-type beta-trefoil lectin domain protein [Streptosporangiaceae bacterium]